MSKQRIFEIISVVALVVFIFVMSFEPGYSDKTAQQVAQTVTESFDVTSLKQFKKNEIIREFDISLDGADSFVYYADDAIMNVSELLIIKLKQDVSADDIVDKIQSRVSEKQVLFEGYAPEQSALLEGYVLYQGNGFIFYAVGDNVTEALSAFKSSVR